MNRSQVAASVAKSKEAYPERFCPAAKCLWNTMKQDTKFCPRHRHIAAQYPHLDKKESVTTNE